MSTRILANDDSDKGETGAILFDGTTGLAYGPKLDDREQAEAFVRYAGEDGDVDPSRFTATEIDAIYSVFLDEWRMCGLSKEQKKYYSDLETKCAGRPWKLNKAQEKAYRDLSRQIAAARVEKFEIEE